MTRRPFAALYPCAQPPSTHPPAPTSQHEPPHLVDAQDVAHEGGHPYVRRHLVAHRQLNNVPRHEVARRDLLQAPLAQHGRARGLRGGVQGHGVVWAAWGRRAVSGWGEARVTAAAARARASGACLGRALHPCMLYKPHTTGPRSPCTDNVPRALSAPLKPHTLTPQQPHTHTNAPRTLSAPRSRAPRCAPSRRRPSLRAAGRGRWACEREGGRFSPRARAAARVPAPCGAAGPE